MGIKNIVSDSIRRMACELPQATYPVSGLTVYTRRYGETYCVSSPDYYRDHPYWLACDSWSPDTAKGFDSLDEVAEFLSDKFGLSDKEIQEAILILE